MRVRGGGWSPCPPLPHFFGGIDMHEYEDRLVRISEIIALHNSKTITTSNAIARIWEILRDYNGDFELVP